MSDASADDQSSIPSKDALRWRIPDGSNRSSLRFALIQVAFATVAVGLLVVFLAPPELANGLLTATVAIALVLALIHTLRAWRESTRPPNVWLDKDGLHWLDAAGREQELPRSLIRGFDIGADEETRRNLPALTFVLENDFVSQPLELHPPADQSCTRAWLREHWELPAQEPRPPEVVPLSVYSELDFRQQIWLLEGNGNELQALVLAWSKAADLPLPPPGARPRTVELEFDGQPLILAVSEHTWIDEGYFSASPKVLRQLVEQLQSELTAETPREEFEFPLKADSGHRWRIIVGRASPRGGDSK